LKKNRHYKYISIKQLISIAKIFNSIFLTKRKKRGRPPKYSDELIMFLFLLKVARRFSFRVLRTVYQDLFEGEVPSLSTLHYRFKRLDTQRLRSMVTILAILIERKLGRIKREYTFCDGTGFGFEKKVGLKYLRGKESKDVKEHVKVELLVGGTSAGDYVTGINVGPPYGDERKLLLQLFEELEIVGDGYFVADALYGMSNKVLEELFERGFIPVIPVRDGIHTKIKSEIRKFVSEIYNKKRSIYSQRYRIEQVIGKIKNSYGDKERAKTYDMAAKSVIAKVILFNYCFLISLLFFANLFKYLIDLKKIRFFSNNLENKKRKSSYQPV